MKADVYHAMAVSQLDTKASAVAILTVTAPDPIISSIPPVTTSTDYSYSYAITATDPVNTPLKYALAIAPGGAVVNGNVVTWIPTPSQSLDPSQFMITVTSNAGGSTIQEWTVTPKSSAISNTTDFTFQNDFYKAVIPKPGNPGQGLIRFLYVKKADGTLSNNLVKLDTLDYGLGFLEGQGLGIGNSSTGLSNPSMTVAVTENTPDEVKVSSSYTTGGVAFSQVWTFWTAKPYFRSEANAVVTDPTGFITNQLQYAWMVNDSLNPAWFGSDETGAAKAIKTWDAQNIQSPLLTATHPWVNVQFASEKASLGWLFTDIYDHYGTIGESGRPPFEYQLDFELSGGTYGSPLIPGYQRPVTTIYLVSPAASNNDIVALASSMHEKTGATATNNPVIQAAQVLNNPFDQNPGWGSVLVNSPYFLVRQNTQYVNRPTGPQYKTSIFAPLYGMQSSSLVNSADSYDWRDQLEFSLNYDNNTTIFPYGTITATNPTNGETVSMQHTAASSDGVLNYDSTFTTWHDSDKLEITGSASNGSASAPVKDIYLALAMSNPPNFAMESISSPSIVNTLTDNDSKWSLWNPSYPGQSGAMLLYRDRSEKVPPLALSLPVPDSTYRVTAWVKSSPDAPIIYRYSLDGVTFTPFTVTANATTNQIVPVDLGNLSISSGTFYIADDGTTSGGTSGYAGWNRVMLGPAIKSVGGGVYDVQYTDAAWGELGIAIKITTPSGGTIAVNGSELDLYLYQQPNAHTLTSFSFPFDVQIWPHREWLTNSAQFTDLHTQDVLTYPRHAGICNSKGDYDTTSGTCAGIVVAP